MTNEGCTPLIPAYIVQASLNLSNWWDTTLVVSQQVGGVEPTIRTNLPIVPLSGGLFVRVVASIDLRGADLRGVGWRDVGLNDQDLSGARLQGALLTRAQLKRVNLSRANLEGATLDEAVRLRYLDPPS